MNYKTYKSKHYIYLAVKRVADFIISLTGIIILFLPMILISVLIKLTSKGSVLYKQKRVGLNEKIFVMYKFRTMKPNTPNCPPNKFTDINSYITGVGKFLRKTSLDELPQLFNIVMGKMSIIGPRPGAATNEEELRNIRREKNVFLCKPGLTGWAQVNGRDLLALNIQKKSEYDKYYVDNLSFKLDIICIFLTISTLIKKEGYHEGTENI